MGLFDWVRGQFIDVIDWLDDTNSTLVWRFPRHGNEIKNGAKLIVREGQIAVFVNEGQMADKFGPGTYDLSTQNLPVLSTLKGWKYGFESPFKAEIYFINTRQYMDMKWGTLNPIPMRDADFGIVRVRAFGIYAIRVDADNAEHFLREVVGTDGLFTTSEIEGQLRRTLVSAFTGTLGKSGIPVLDLAGNYDEIAKRCKDKMDSEFESLGLKLTRFLIENISLPKEVEEAIDQRSSMGAIGNMFQFTQYQAAKAMREAATAPGGAAGMSMGMGAGVGLGQAMVGAMAAPMAQPQAPAAPAPAPAPVAAAPAADTIESRLRKLKSLMDSGLIDADTFAAKRDSILADI
jgi:membrane protease subunit (stomatin/prohibitin family)